jgi:hypothetical protein
VAGVRVGDWTLHYRGLALALHRGHYAPARARRYPRDTLRHTTDRTVFTLGREPNFLNLWELLQSTEAVTQPSLIAHMETDVDRSAIRAIADFKPIKPTACFLNHADYVNHRAMPTAISDRDELRSASIGNEPPVSKCAQTD